MLLAIGRNCITKDMSFIAPAMELTDRYTLDGMGKGVLPFRIKIFGTINQAPQMKTWHKLQVCPSLDKTRDGCVSFLARLCLKWNIWSGQARQVLRADQAAESHSLREHTEYRPVLL